MPPGQEATARVAEVLIKAAGTDLSPALMRDLHSVEVDASVHLPAVATIRFYDEQLAHVDGGTPLELGKEITVSFMSNDGKTPKVVFTGRILALEPTYDVDSTMCMLTVRAYDKLHWLHRGRWSRAYVQQKDSDIVSSIAGEAGMSATVTATTTVHKHVFREDMSDFELLKFLAARNGYVAFADEGKLIFGPPSSLSRGTVNLEYGETCLEFRPAVSLTGQVDSVTVQGWDRQQKQAVTGRASSAKFAPTTIGLGSRGHKLAQEHMNSRTMHVGDVFPEQQDAETVAGAILDRLAGNDVTGEGLAVGNPDLKAGCKVQVSAVGTRFGGTYFVSRVVHRIRPEDAYTTEFYFGGMNTGTLASLVAPEARNPAAVARPFVGLMPAIVTNNNDEDGLSRVKLKFPWLAEDLESYWAPVVSVGAGNNRGFAVLPEVNDEVLVGFAAGDFNRPYVLGGLWNGQDAPPDPQSTLVQQGKVETRIFKTRAGHLLRFTDKSGSEKIELIDAKSKNSIVIDTANDKITITSGKDIALEAPQGRISLNAMNIDMKATQGFTAKGAQSGVEATGQLTLKGAMAELTGQSMAKVSAAMVMIN